MRRRVMLALGCGLSFALLLWVFSRLDWGLFFASLSQVQLGWVALAALAVPVTISLRAERWRTLAGLLGAQSADFFRAASIGYLGNYIYPLRAGELMRVLALKQLVGEATFGRSLASAAVDRAFDLVGVGVFLGIVLHAHGVAALGAQAVRGAAALVLLSCASIVVFVFTARRWRLMVEALASRLPGAAARWLRLGYQQALEAAEAASPARLAVAFGLSLIASVGDYFIVWSLLRAFGWELGALAAVTLGLFVQIGGSLPSAPGFVGVVQLACVLALALYGVAESAAVAFSVLYQLTLLTMVAVCGLWAAASAGLSLSARPGAAQPELN